MEARIGARYIIDDEELKSVQPLIVDSMAPDRFLLRESSCRLEDYKLL